VYDLTVRRRCVKPTHTPPRATLHEPFQYWDDHHELVVRRLTIYYLAPIAGYSFEGNDNLQSQGGKHLFIEVEDGEVGGATAVAANTHTGSLILGKKNRLPKGSGFSRRDHARPRSWHSPQRRGAVGCKPELASSANVRAPLKHTVANYCSDRSQRLRPVVSASAHGCKSGGSTPNAVKHAHTCSPWALT
jgi:hypothetical protein